MLIGLAMILSLGLLWSGVGAIMARVASHGIPVSAFYVLAAALNASLLAMRVRWSLIPETPWPVPLLACVCGFAIANTLGQVSMILGMRQGPKRVTWSVGQSAMLIPFLAGVLLWQEQPGLIGWSGMALLLTALVGYGIAGGGSEKGYSWRWCGCAFGAMALIGSGQVLATMPSHWPEPVDPANLRAFMTALATCLVHALICLRRRQTPPRQAVAPALLWAILAATAYTLTYVTLDHMSAYGLSALVFPSGVAVCIIGFAMYARVFLGERIKPLEGGMLLLTVLGLTLLALRGLA